MSGRALPRSAMRMPGTPTILQTILRRKAEEVGERAARVGLRELGERAKDMAKPRPFAAALAARVADGDAAVIAEMKHASPSRGVLREPYEPALIARTYAACGATALSVLTDRDFFRGDDAHLTEARGACDLPVMRKEFIIDAYQVYESRVLGADCVLLIVAALGDALLGELAGLARHLDMDVLVEVHDEAELERALAVPTSLLGINNRDLHTFETSLDTTIRMLDRIPADRLVVTESGIHTREDVTLMRRHGVHAFLVGEAFMRAPDPGARLAALFGDETPGT